MTLTVMALFGGLTALLLGLVYADVVGFAESQLRATIQAEAASQIREADEHDVAHLAGALQAIAERWSHHTFAYLLLDPQGRRMAGSLAVREPAEGWQELMRSEAEGGRPSDGADEEPLLALGTRLEDGSLLIVAREAEALEDLREHFGRTLGLGLLGTAVLAALGGAWISSRWLGRIDAVNQAAMQIMQGDLARRVPRSGSGDELDRLAANLNAMLARIERLVANLRRVTSDVAHDLRTPVARLRHHLEDVRAERQSAEAYETAIDSALAQTDAILDTFTALLRIAEIEAGARVAGFEAFGLSDLCRRLAETYAPVVEDSGRALDVEIAPAVGLTGDPDLITQMLANLIENAIRHTPAGTRIRLALAAGQGRPELVVADDGPGIPPEATGSVIEPFSRLDASRTTPGHGLGLALVAAVAELHGATLALADNRPGLKVSVRFPGH